MSTVKPRRKTPSLNAQIEDLRAQLEKAAFCAPPQEVLALSRRLDALINQAMLSTNDRTFRSCYRLSIPPKFLCEPRLSMYTGRPCSRRPASFYKKQRKGSSAR